MARENKTKNTEGGRMTYGIKYEHKGEIKIERFVSKEMFRGFIFAIRTFEEYAFVEAFTMTSGYIKTVLTKY